MIQVRIHLDKTTNLFKNLKKRGFLCGHRGTLFIWLKQKPSIGELISIDYMSVDGQDFKEFMNRRHKAILLRVVDLCYSHSVLKSDKNGMDCIELRCYEDKSINWLS